jgi:hypothetical protein
VVERALVACAQSGLGVTEGARSERGVWVPALQPNRTAALPMTTGFIKEHSCPHRLDVLPRSAGSVVFPQSVVTSPLQRPRAAFPPPTPTRNLHAVQVSLGLLTLSVKRHVPEPEPEPVSSWVTPRARWVTLKARWVTLRARWVTLRARWVTLRARWVTPRARWVTVGAHWVTLRAHWVTFRYCRRRAACVKWAVRPPAAAPQARRACHRHHVWLVPAVCRRSRLWSVWAALLCVSRLGRPARAVAASSRPRALGHRPQEPRLPPTSG